MTTRVARLAVAAGILIALVSASAAYAADQDELARAMASAEQRSLAARMAEPAYPSQAPAPSRTYALHRQRYV